MDIIKKIFCFNNDDDSPVGLCKFNDQFYKNQENKQNFKKKLAKDPTLSEILRKPI